MQHSVQPTRQTSHGPLRRAASAMAASTIWIKAPSRASIRGTDCMVLAAALIAAIQRLESRPRLRLGLASMAGVAPYFHLAAQSPDVGRIGHCDHLSRQSLGGVLLRS